MTGIRLESARGQKKLRSGQCGCPGGGKEAIQPPLSTGSCNCQASEEEKPEPDAIETGRDSSSPSRVTAKNNFSTLRGPYGAITHCELLLTPGHMTVRIWT